MVDPKKYRPANISQRDTLLSRDGIDDCRAVSATWLAATSTAGEVFTWPNGNTMGRRNRTALVKRARRSLGPAHATGSLNTSHTTQMLAWLVPDAPPAHPANITFGELRAALRNGFSASLSGNPAHIRVPLSPLKRAGNVGHEFFLWGERENGDILVGDPFRPYQKRFGEWRPWREVRQFAYQDSDGDLTAVFAIKRGAWTQAELNKDDLRKARARIAAQARSIRELDEQVAALERELMECNDGDAAREQLLDALDEWIKEQRL